MMKKEYDDDDEFDANIVLLRCESSLTTSPVSGARLTLAPALLDGYYPHHHHHHHYDCQSHHHIIVLLTISSSNYNTTLLI